MNKISDTANLLKNRPLAFNPWFIRLWGMETYAGARIRKITFNLREIYQATANQSVPGADISATGHTVTWLHDTLREIRSEAIALGLSLTAKGIERQLMEIQDSTSCTDIRYRMEEMERRIVDELDSVSFVHVKNENLKYLKGIELFGTTVGGAFPGAKYEIIEAGNCLAVECGTAAVFHLMRGLEPCLMALCKALRVKYEDVPWGENLNALKTEIDNMPNGSDKEFYEAAYIHFDHIKHAWRNQAMHAKSKYTPGEATEIWESTRYFMQKLAEKIRE